MRVRLLPLLVVLSGCASTASVSGDAFAFNEGTDARVEGARVYVLEDPSHEVLTDATGHFVLEGLEVGTDATLVLDHPDFVAIQTATFEVPAEGLERVTFQAVRPNIYDALAALLSITPDPERCQMVTTVTRVGRSLYDPGAHGEAGAPAFGNVEVPASLSAGSQGTFSAVVSTWLSPSVGLPGTTSRTRSRPWAAPSPATPKRTPARPDQWSSTRIASFPPKRTCSGHEPDIKMNGGH